MDGGIVHLETTLINFAFTGINPCIFALGVIGIHSADTGKLQPAVGLDLGDHAAESIKVCGEHDRFSLAAEAAEHTALFSHLGRITESVQLVHSELSGFLCEAAGAVNRHKLFKCFNCVIHNILR